MPYLTYEDLEPIILNYPNKKIKFEHFLETGTCKGETIQRMDMYFKKLYTVEIKKQFYNLCLKENNSDKISFYLGDSVKTLPRMLKDVGNNTVVFFLDGHWSCGTTGKGSKDVPLLDEIEIINKLYNNNAIVIIDDYNLFDGNDKYVDWSEITLQGVLNRIDKNKIIKYYEVNNRLILYLQKI